MDNFSRCFAFTVGFEGGFTVNASDPGNWTGGAVGQGLLNGTKFGISAAAYPQLDIATLTEDAARDIYRSDYWVVIQGDALPTPVALTTFDAAVNCGPRRAVIWLQQAAGLMTDGNLGPVSLAAVAKGDAVALAADSLARRIDYAARLSTWSVFGLGWARRFIALARVLTT